MSGYAPGTFRVWDGSDWRFKADSWGEPEYESIKHGATSAVGASTTTCSRTPATVHKGSSVTISASTTGRNGGNIDFYYYTGTTWVKFATKAAPVGGGTVSITNAPGYTTNYMAKFTGSATHTASESAAAGVTTVQTQKSATKTVNKQWHEAYNGDGRKLSGSGHDGAIHQGFYSGAHGNRRSLVRFDPNLPAGASVTKVVLQCNNSWDNWYYSKGGTIVIGSLIDQDTQPTNWPGSPRCHPNRSQKSVNTGSWSIDISSWGNSVVGRSDFSGLCFGPGPSTAHEFYGYSDAPLLGVDFQLVVSYTYWS